MGLTESDWSANSQTEYSLTHIGTNENILQTASFGDRACPPSRLITARLLSLQNLTLLANRCQVSFNNQDPNTLQSVIPHYQTKRKVPNVFPFRDIETHKPVVDLGVISRISVVKGEGDAKDMVNAFYKEIGSTTEKNLIDHTKKLTSKIGWRNANEDVWKYTVPDKNDAPKLLTKAQKAKAKKEEEKEDSDEEAPNKKRRKKETDQKTLAEARFRAPNATADSGLSVMKKEQRNTEGLLSIAVEDCPYNTSAMSCLKRILLAAKFCSV
eukprot:gene19351-6594_t